MNAYLGSEDTDGVTKTRVTEDHRGEAALEHIRLRGGEPAGRHRTTTARVSTTRSWSRATTPWSRAGSAAVGNDPGRSSPAPRASGQFYDVVGGFHNASAANLFSGKGNCAILDGHVEAFTRAETFPHAYPRQ